MAKFNSYKLGNNSEFRWNKSIPGLINGLGFNKAFNIAAAETAARYMNPFVPMQSGVLSQTYETGQDLIGGYVRYASPYAHRQYNGIDFNFSKEQHPLATHHWDKAMMLSKGEQYVNELDLLRKRFSE